MGKRIKAITQDGGRATRERRVSRRLAGAWLPWRGTPVVFTADPLNQVGEGNEQGNVLQRTCRAAQGN